MASAVIFFSMFPTRKSGDSWRYLEFSHGQNEHGFGATGAAGQPGRVRLQSWGWFAEVTQRVCPQGRGCVCWSAQAPSREAANVPAARVVTQAPCSPRSPAHTGRSVLLGRNRFRRANEILRKASEHLVMYMTLGKGPLRVSSGGFTSTRPQRQELQCVWLTCHQESPVLGVSLHYCLQAWLSVGQQTSPPSLQHDMCPIDNAR